MKPRRLDSKKLNSSAMRSILHELDFSTFLILAIAGTINAFGVTIFLFPVKLYDSGISIGTFVLIFNTALYIICGLVIHSWILPL